MKKVTVYSSQTCPWCHRAKDFLTEKGVKFEDKDVSNQENAKEAVEKSGQIGVPVLEIDDTVIVGFDQPQIEKALGG